MGQSPILQRSVKDYGHLKLLRTVNRLSLAVATIPSRCTRLAPPLSELNEGGRSVSSTLLEKSEGVKSSAKLDGDWRFSGICPTHTWQRVRYFQGTVSRGNLLSGYITLVRHKSTCKLSEIHYFLGGRMQVLCETGYIKVWR